MTYIEVGELLTRDTPSMETPPGFVVRPPSWSLWPMHAEAAPTQLLLLATGFLGLNKVPGRLCGRATPRAFRRDTRSPPQGVCNTYGRRLWCSQAASPPPQRPVGR